ncbi:MAG: DUF3592 domain-containing protein [Saprospiraceae bacterium]|nr:DUF3592 domain-containing protein [Saprospiraceae bacterium]
MNIFPILLAAFFALLSTYIALGGIWQVWRSLSLYRSGYRTTGTVTHIKTELRYRKGRAYTSYTAVISFETAGFGQQHLEYANPLGSNSFAVGDRLTIWYDVHQPSRNTLGGRYFWQDLASFIVFAVCFGLPGWTLLIHVAKPYFFG